MTEAHQNKNRLIVDHYPEGVEVTIHAKKSNFFNLFLACWLAGWMVGGVVIFDKLTSHDDQVPDAFLVVWSCGWILGGLFAVIVGLWNIRGREIVRVGENALKHTRVYVLFSRSKIYEARQITNLRVFDLNPTMPVMSGGMEFWGLSGGAIAFDYGHSTQKFGLGLNEAEATHIVEAIQSRYEKLLP
jgi:hypothetical protein